MEPKPTLTIRTDLGSGGFTDIQAEMFEKNMKESRLADDYEIVFYDDQPCDGGSCGQAYYFEDGNYSEDKDLHSFICFIIQEIATYIDENY